MQAGPQTTHHGLNLVRVWKTLGTAIPPSAFGAGRWIYHGETFQGLGFIKVWSSRGSGGEPPTPSATGYIIFKRRRR